MTSFQASAVLRAFVEQRKFILVTTKAKKPDMNGPAFMQLLKPFNEIISVVTEIREKNRGSPFFNQLSTVSESITVLAWVTADSKPHKVVEENLASAQFWGNRVLKDYKEKYALFRLFQGEGLKYIGTPSKWNGYNHITRFSRT